MILKRKKLRILYSDCCQKIINVNFRISEIKRKKNKSNLINSNQYAHCLLELENLTNEKIITKRKIDDMVINSEMDKLGDLEVRIREDLTIINSNLSKIYETSVKIKKIKKNQMQLLENIDDILKITSN